MRLTKLLKKILMMVKQIFEEVFDDGEDIFEEVEEVIKERSYLVIKAKVSRIVKEVMRSDGL